MLRHILFTTSLNDHVVSVERRQHIWVSFDGSNLPLTAAEARLLARVLGEQAELLDTDHDIV